MKAVLPRATCRNCTNKQHWRVKCGDPDDTFFIMSEKTASMETAVQTLRSLQIGKPVVVSKPESVLFERAQISLFNVSPRKRPIDFQEKVRQMEKLRRQLCTADARPLSTELANELAMRTSSEVMNMLSVTPLVGATALLPVSPTRELRRPSVLLPVYRNLLSSILLQSGYVRVVRRSELENMMVAMLQTTRAVTVPSDNDLGRLFMQLGVPYSATLYVKPCVTVWLRKICSLSKDVVSFRLGFYVAPTCQILQSLKSDDQLPPFLRMPNMDSCRATNMHLRVPSSA
jgi:hypothetical protein